MRPSYVILLSLLGGVIPLGASNPDNALQKRQDTATTGSGTSFPSLTTDSPIASTESASSTSEAVTSESARSTGDTDPSRETATSSEQRSTTASRSSSTTSPSPTADDFVASNGTDTSGDAKQEDNLPWEPTITPALGIAGVFLIVLGSIYALIGVKSRWVQIFLSTGFLASTATAALVEYVMHPPVTNAIQGGFFVAIFMTGLVFGAGALVFKEFTEGFGCLLGGFSFSMWLLTLKAGGLITNPVGKGVFIGVFCILAWALSFSSYTRPYALIGSTSFSGATAFVLGIDCFTRAGMKEFWFYIWDLNDDLFPLDTTFPLTKGMRVEIAVIIIGTIIGVLSQIKLWKVIKTKEKVVEANQQEVDRQQEAIDAALGLHLQRQNDREKSQWEKQYGDRLQSKRNTVLWQDAHPEKRYSSVSVVPVQPVSAPTDSLEMNVYTPRRISGYGSKNKRQSSVAVDVIEEIEEDPVVVAETERRKALQALEEVDISAEAAPSKDDQKARGFSTAKSTNYKSLAGEEPTDTGKSSDPNAQKRQSQQLLPRLSKRLSQPNIGPSESNENLLETERPYSRASSVAATMDGANEELDLPALENGEDDVPMPPEIVISPVGSDTGESRNIGLHLPTESSKFSSHLPEAAELASDSTALNDGLGSSNVSSTEGVDKDAPRSHKDYSQSQTTGSSNSSADSLTALALAQVPSQLSNVVLSYRTNEWAKHISVAEVPVCDEPEPIDGNDEELPTQLARPIPEAEKTFEPNVPAVEVPQAEMLPPSVKANNGGVGIAASPTFSQRSFSDPDRRKSTTIKTPSRTGSMQSLKLPGHRNSRNSFDPGSTTSLVTTPIDENVPTVFAAHRRPERRVSNGSYMQPNRISSTSSLTGPSAPRPHTSRTATSPYPNNTSTASLPYSIRPSSQQAPMQMGTRLDSYDSRQPSWSGNRNNNERRESLLAEWRLSQQQRATNQGISGTAVDTGRAQMQAERETRRIADEYLKREQQRKQQTMDQVMRRPDMQDAHREAMRRMQANANNTLRNSSA
ncbi:uncharacterized protein A1O9_02852 [Exophiala aquamarina CBS 119918]|uniref:TM7S3/TM198-like domain-containing protein n=1 Tax=Exophiala aquamarina CBS 119918 TaxID=1182545 RepID=A0A072PNJ7_9EURO|nr:uncharacterized protein A1O9_02852 [Exophiala aquamarina CBS 119918]KEF61287.1 hypothetical protein A1O9_02852 [Exophiala aquamarina CBS 119918]